MPHVSTTQTGPRVRLVPGTSEVCGAEASSARSGATCCQSTPRHDLCLSSIRGPGSLHAAGKPRTRAVQAILQRPRIPQRLQLTASSAACQANHAASAASACCSRRALSAAATLVSNLQSASGTSHPPRRKRHFKHRQRSNSYQSGWHNWHSIRLLGDRKHCLAALDDHLHRFRKHLIGSRRHATRACLLTASLHARHDTFQLLQSHCNIVCRCDCVSTAGTTATSAPAPYIRLHASGRVYSSSSETASPPNMRTQCTTGKQAEPSSLINKERQSGTRSLGQKRARNVTHSTKILLPCARCRVTRRALLSPMVRRGAVEKRSGKYSTLQAQPPSSLCFVELYYTVRSRSRYVYTSCKARPLYIFISV